MKKTQRQRSHTQSRTGKKKGRAQSPIKIKRILVPVDFSEYSLGAVRYAVRFAKQFDSELFLLHVIEPVVYATDFSFGQIAFPNVEDELHRRSEGELQRLRDTVRKDVPASSLLRLGKPFLEITETARELKVDMIIIASHGHTGVEHILFGSTAEKVIRKAHCPVLTVRSSQK